MTIQFQTRTPPTEKYWDLFQTTGWNNEYRATPEELARALAKSWFVVAAYEDGQLVGFGRVVSDEALHAMIYDLIVAPAYQQQGLGTQILEMLVKACLDAHIRDIQLFCARGKQAFYEKRGFVARPADAPGMQYRKA
jgi:GNAT superfamily N-acetyltransferase